MHKSERSAKPTKRKASVGRPSKDSSEHRRYEKSETRKLNSNTTKIKPNPEAGDYNRSEERSSPRREHKVPRQKEVTEHNVKREKHAKEETPLRRKHENPENTRVRSSDKDRDISRKSAKDSSKSRSKEKLTEAQQTAQKHHAQKSSHREFDSTMLHSREQIEKSRRAKESSPHPLERITERLVREHPESKRQPSMVQKSSPSIGSKYTNRDEHLVPGSKNELPEKNSVQENEPYADDFEDYGSDFEQADSTNSLSSTSEESETKLKTPRYPTADATQDEFPQQTWSFVTNSTAEVKPRPDDHQKEAHVENSQLIDFNKSIQTNRFGVRQRLSKRAQDLLRLIDLDFEGSGHVFELKPLDEYASYMVRYGKANRSQVHVQTNEDALDRDIQTEPIYSCKGGGVWTQWPPLDTGECFGGAINFDKSTFDGSISQVSTTSEDLLSTLLNDLIKDFRPHYPEPSNIESSTDLEQGPLASSPTLLKQLRLVLRILEEESLPDLEHFTAQELFRSAKGSQSEKQSQSVYGSSGCLFGAFSPFNGDKLVTVHCSSKVHLEEQYEDRCAFNRPSGELIYVWSISDDSGVPQFQLLCPGLLATEKRGCVISCVSFSPDSDANYVIGGLTDGSLCLWDLRDCPNELQTVRRCSNHLRTQTSDDKIKTRSPIYSTSGIEIQQLGPMPLTHEMQPNSLVEKAEANRHNAGIIKLELINIMTEKPIESNFQFAALDAMGELSLWMVITQCGAKGKSIFETLAGSQIDLGLRPSQQTVQMLRLMYMNVRIPYAEPNLYSLSENEYEEDKKSFLLEPDQCQKVKAVATAVCVTPGGNFLVGFNDGQLVQEPRSLGATVYPREFQCPPGQAAITSLAVHPERTLNIVLAGYADGVIRLFSLRHPFVLQQWYLSQTRIQLTSVVKVAWASAYPSVFFSLDSYGHLCSWDVMGSLACKEIRLYTEAEQHVSEIDHLTTRIIDFSIGHSTLVNMGGKLIPSIAVALISPNTVKVQWLHPDSVGTTQNTQVSLEAYLDEIITQ